MIDPAQFKELNQSQVSYPRYVKLERLKQFISTNPFNYFYAHAYEKSNESFSHKKFAANNRSLVFIFSNADLGNLWLQNVKYISLARY